VAPTVSFDECAEELTTKADWAFAKWEAPRAAAYHKPRPGPTGPAWWTATFPPVDATRPLYFDASGLTKGQLYINGRHLGRYFVATSGGKPVPPQSHYYVPAPWLNTGEENHVMIFDEHGATPARARLTYDAPRSAGGAD
jgi:hypothetical protein